MIGCRVGRLSVIATTLVLLATPVPAMPPGPTIAERLGAGNLETTFVGERLAPLYDALRATGLGMGRMNAYFWRRPDGRPNIGEFDQPLAQAWANGIVPIFLFEYYGSYAGRSPPEPPGSYADWHAIGRAYAERFGPGGTFAEERGLDDFGVTVFTAINEPDVERSIPLDAYRDALAGLADGVHSVDPDLKVVPGGFATCNSHQDPTLRGYAPAIAGLLNDGTLDGIDLHTYYDERWFPLTRGQTFSAQACFDAIKRAAGIERDIAFYATEFNVAAVEADGRPMGEAQLARLFLTALFDHLGVVGNDRRTPQTVLAFPWNLAETGRAPASLYAMARLRHPWIGDVRAAVLRRVVELAGDMVVVAADRERGLVRAERPGASLVVWHNRRGWTDRPGSSFDLALPDDATSVQVWTARGLERTVPAPDGRRLHLRRLPRNQSLMFLIER